MIGIISYLPNDEIKRNVRYWRMRQLLENIKTLFPKEHVLIVAQNYMDSELADIDKSVEIRQFDKLGIIKARNTLRQIFLDSKEDYLIMYDDDSELVWYDDNAGKLFLNCLLTNKYGVVFQKLGSCKNVGIKREVVEKIKFRSENGHDYGEDTCFSADLLTLFGLQKNFNEFLNECLRSYIVDNSPYGGEPYRTWTVDDLA